MRVPVVSSSRPRFEQQPRNGGDGGQRFAAEAERGDGEQILDVAQFAGGVALEGQQGVVAQHAAAIVGNADQAAAAGFDFHAHIGRARVERIFEQFLDHRSGPLDNFAGGDLIGDLVGKDADAAHVPTITGIPLRSRRAVGHIVCAIYNAAFTAAAISASAVSPTNFFTCFPVRSNTIVTGSSSNPNLVDRSAEPSPTR